MKKIIFYAASSTNIPKEKIGGAEAGSKRTYELLLKNGFDIDYIPKATTFNGKIKFIFELLKCRNLILKDLKKNKNNCVFYITAFYKKQFLIEYYFCRLAKKYCASIIYEPKNGSFVKSFSNCKKRYKKFIDKTLDLSSYIFCQGLEYIDYLEKSGRKNAIYIPNYVKNDFDITYKVENDKVIKLVYFGRVTMTKNIAFILEVVYELSKTHKVTCDIIGACDKNYFLQLQEIINKYNLKEQVIFHERMPLNEIVKLCGNKDFFIFPSMELEEGHSNSLTEAMGMGLVPIVSNYGFNASIVGDQVFVMDNFDIKKYVERIIYLYKDLEKYKIFCNNRVKDNYTEKIVLKRQLKVIKYIIDYED